MYYVLTYTVLDDENSFITEESYPTWSEANKAAKEIKRLGIGTNFLITDIGEIEERQNDYDCDSLVGTSYESESFFDY